MPFHSARQRRWPLALSTIVIGACADDTLLTAPRSTLEPSFAFGDVITVTTASGGTEVGSLRWALTQATGGEIIRFDSSLAGSTIASPQTIDVTVPVTIEGPKDKGVAITTGGNGGVFHVTAASFTLRNLTVTGGKVASGSGGGIDAFATDLVLENTTVSGNEAEGASAFAAKGATLINSTISGNTSTGGYAATFTYRTLTLTNSTIANNNQGGVQNDGNLVLRNSIVAGNGAKPNCGSFGTIAREGRNISSDWSCGDTSVMIVADPKLDSLSDNGGPAKTHRLQRTSPAINAAKDCSVTVDERHVPRGAKCDIGAFEFTDFSIITVKFDPSISVNPTNGYAVLTGTVQCTTDESIDLALSLEQVQKLRRSQATVRAEATQTLDCGPTPRVFASAMVPTSGGFINNSATAKANATSAPAWVAPSDVASDVKLYWGHR